MAVMVLLDTNALSALWHGDELVTFDEHFGHVPGLRRWEV